MRHSGTVNSSLTLRLERPRLAEAQVVGVGGPTAAHQAGLLATNLRWALSRMRRGSGKLKLLLSMASELAGTSV